MNFSCQTLEERLHRERQDFFRKAEFQRKCQEMVDYIAENEWLSTVKDTFCHASISTSFFSKSLTFTFSNIKVDDFIENVLGPFHLKYDIKWRLEFEGSEAEPIMIFRPIGYYPMTLLFRVKEGEYRQCKFVRRVIEFTEPEESSPIYRLDMVCE